MADPDAVMAMFRRRFPEIDEKLIAADLQKTRQILEHRGAAGRAPAKQLQRKKK